MSAFMGIDPGASGSLCLINTERLDIQLFFETPGPLVTAWRVADWIRRAHEECYVRTIMIENVGTVQGTSATSNFKFGFNVGVVRGIAEASGLSVDLIRPKAWQKAIGLVQKKRTPTQLKKDIAEIASRLYPQAELFGPKGGLLDGRSDALMLAHVAMLKYEGGL